MGFGEGLCCQSEVFTSHCGCDETEGPVSMEAHIAASLGGEKK